MARQTGILLITLLLLAVARGALADHPKVDKVMVKNGDEVTCEIKQMSRGMLTAKTSDMGTLDIKWTEVIALKSQFYYRVETSAGDRFYGAVERKPGSDMLVISGETTVAIEALDAVDIAPIEQSFWQRNDGSLSFGFSYTKGSDVRQITFDWSNLYRTERNAVNIKANAITTTTAKGKDDEDTNRQYDASITYTRLLTKKRWTGSLSVSMERNDELGLKRRIKPTVGTGLSLIKSNRQTLMPSVGLALNWELGADTTAASTSAEAYLSVNYAFFKYISPKTDITTTAAVYPSLTEDGRIRFDYDLKYSHELVKDFTANVSLFLKYDSQPVTEGAGTTDWGIVMSVGWSY
jgi:hypothetical protein